MENPTSPFEIESFELPALEAKIQQLYDGYLSNRGDGDYLGCLNDVLGLRKSILNERFVFTPQAVMHFERINKLMIEQTAKLLAKTETLYEQMKANKKAGDDFLDDFHLEATLEVGYRGEESILILEADENAGECDYNALAEIISFTPNAFCKPLRSFHLHNHETCPFPPEEMLADNQFLGNWDTEENWDENLLRIPELQHIPYICYALRGLVIHSNYSFSDILRINDIRCEVSVDWRNGGNSDFYTPDFQQELYKMTSYNNVPLTGEDLEKAKTKYAGLKRLMTRDVESPSIISLEAQIKKRYQQYLHARSGYEGTLLHDIRELLSQRKEIINKNFKFTPLAIKHIERVNELLNSATLKVHSQVLEMNRVLNEAKSRGTDFAQDYNWEAYVQVGWEDENNLMEFEEDENKGVSDYIAMAEILNETRRYNNLRGFHCFECSENEKSANESKNFLEDDLGKLNWNIEIFEAPELAHIPYICYASHDLFHHHYYSLSDIIRITDIRCEIELQMTHRVK